MTLLTGLYVIASVERLHFVNEIKTRSYLGLRSSAIRTRTVHMASSVQYSGAVRPHLKTDADAAYYIGQPSAVLSADRENLVPAGDIVNKIAAHDAQDSLAAHAESPPACKFYSFEPI